MRKNKTTQNTFRISRKAAFLLTGILICILGLTIAVHVYIDKIKPRAAEVPLNNDSGCPAALTVIRANDNKLINRLYFEESPTESSKFNVLKIDLSRIIFQYTGKGSVQSTSVYCKDLTDGSWMSIDGDRRFLPGSMTKVPIMIYYLMMKQLHKIELNKELLYVKPKQNFPSQVFKGDSILDGRKYTISELLKYMIVESDNNATHLLARNLESEPFRRIFTDLEIPPDEINDVNYQISAKEYSRFLMVLYNATYLHRDASEKALELLTKCKFNSGITKMLPTGTVVAHKFGECGRDNDITFGESAIIYLKDRPYLLTILTYGSQILDQTSLVSELSADIYHFMSN
ncbi:MAG: serine hydrolase [Bacteroidales bacterium]|jgi:hypothetical protein